MGLMPRKGWCLSTKAPSVVFVLARFERRAHHVVAVESRPALQARKMCGPHFPEQQPASLQNPLAPGRAAKLNNQP